VNVRVRRKPLFPFFVALAGLPLVAIAFDFFTGARLLNRIGEVVYNSDVDPFELRDAFLASLFAFMGGTMVLWGLRDLVVPKPILKADPDALRLAVRGPFGRLTNVVWSELEEAKEATREVDGQTLPALALTVSTQGELPDEPWGARWVGGHTLVMDATRWDTTLADVVSELTRLRHQALVAAPPPIPEA